LKVNLVVNGSTAKVHGIAELALFGNCLLMRRRMDLKGSGVTAVLVTIKYCLPSYKNKQQQPGAKDMVFIFFQ
jgi:hypothetical protein